MMRTLDLAAALILGILVTGSSSATVIYAEVSGSANPNQITATAANSLTNGDFVITQDPLSCCSTLLGDGNNDDTAWIFDFGSSANKVLGKTMASAMLSLTLQTTAGVVSDTIEIVGLGARAATEIRSLSGGFNGSITFDLLNYYSSASILTELGNPSAGQLRMIYEDDAIISFASLSLKTVSTPTSLALILIGVTGFGVRFRKTGAPR